MKRVVVIGAGIGGLTTAATLARLGFDVTVLEAHVYPGGCAGTFFHKGYRFDAGATLSAGFDPGGAMDVVAHSTGVKSWPTRSNDQVMVVHLPGGLSVPRLSGEDRKHVYREYFGQGVDRFWNWQERTADAMWDLALRMPAWPPQSAGQAFRTIKTGIDWLADDPNHRMSPGLLSDFLKPVAAQLTGQSPEFRLFVDAQLLISAQTESQEANALYAASALDLPRRGVVHLAGGMGAIAEQLVDAIHTQGGRVLYRQQATKIQIENRKPVAVETKRGESFPTDLVVANLTPWNIRDLMADAAPYRIRRLPPQPRDGWGAFMIYLGVDASAIPADAPLHHQIISDRPLGEGNSIFLSISPAWDQTRAPAGKRAITISTHTKLDPWWQLNANDPDGYEARKNLYTKSMLSLAESVIPGLGQAVDLTMPGTPLSFHRFTRRAFGWVGGFPQTNLFRSWKPQILPGIWMVGDSIFPGQSTAAVALGGLRVANEISREHAEVDKPIQEVNYAISGD
jgi:C-3',4' desaturase CrtD